MTVSRTVQIAALGTLSALLLLGFFFLYLRSSEGAPLEITGATPVVDSQPATGNSSGAPLEAEAKPSPSLQIYIAGAVQKPDVYTLQPGDRLVDAVRAAGGGTVAADLESVNLALRVQDEGYYFIPTQVNTPAVSSATSPEKPADGTDSAGEKSSSPISLITADPMTGELPAVAGKEIELGTLNGLIDINTADKEQLETLPSIGPARAEDIIAYREQSGPFTIIDEITDVPGIGPGIFDNIQDLITAGAAP